MGRRRKRTMSHDKFFGHVRRCAICAFISISLLTAAATARAGDIVSASCPCGFQRQGMPIFGGVATYKTTCLFPALCRATRAMVLGDLMDPAAGAKECPASELVFYNDLSLAPVHPGKVVASWNMPQHKGRAILYEGGYVCPVCGQRTLRFRHVGVWD